MHIDELVRPSSTFPLSFSSIPARTAEIWRGSTFDPSPIRIVGSWRAIVGKRFVSIGSRIRTLGSRITTLGSRITTLGSQIIIVGSQIS